MNKNWTTRFRIAYAAAFVLTVVAALVGWLLFGRDPSQLQPVLMFTATACGVGEASNIGKRVTWKKEAADAMQ